MTGYQFRRELGCIGRDYPSHLHAAGYQFRREFSVTEGAARGARGSRRSRLAGGFARGPVSPSPAY